MEKRSGSILALKTINTELGEQRPNRKVNLTLNWGPKRKRLPKEVYKGIILA